MKKKFKNKNVFSVATKISNEEILTKNSVTGVRMKNFNIWVVH